MRTTRTQDTRGTNPENPDHSEERHQLEKHHKPPEIFLCVGPNVWGKGFTEGQAITACREELHGGRRLPEYILYATTDPWAFIDGMGSLCHEQGTTYREVRRKGGSKS